jgi:GNAT superfamily N-acetyltransferase
MLAVDPFVAILVDAFWLDPWLATLAPADHGRRRALTVFFRAIVRYSHRHAGVTTSADASAIACWLPPEHPAIKTWGLVKQGIWRLPLALGRRRMSQFLAQVEFVDRLRARLQPSPHYYLTLLAVSPRVQGTGVGGRLLESVLQQSDERSLPCYLETFNPRNVPFYARHGFEVIEEAESTVPGVRAWAMRHMPAKHIDQSVQDA